MWSYNAAPTEEMTQAEEAILSAQTAVGDVYTTEDFKAATDALADAWDKLLSKSYPEAKAAAIDAQAKAVIAKAHVEAARLAQKTDRLGQWTALQAAELKLSTMKNDQVAVKAAAVKFAVKLQKKKAAELNREVANLEASLATAQEQIDQGNAMLAMAQRQVDQRDVTLAMAQEQIDRRNTADMRLTLENLEAASAQQIELKNRLGLVSPAPDRADKSLVSTAGMGTITGTVKFSKEESAPRVTQLMKGVMVSPNDGIKDVSISLLAQNGYLSTTDKGGNFSLINVPPGAYTVQCSHPKLGKQEVKITVIADRIAKIDFSYFYWSR
jgi:hypothetical protein